VVRASTLLLVACAACNAAGLNRDAYPGVDRRPPNATNQRPAFEGQTRAPEQKLGVAFDVLTVATKLSHPLSIAFLPDGHLLVTERDGRLRTVDRGGTLSPPVAGLPPVDARGQGGLLGLALDPAFGSNR